MTYRSFLRFTFKWWVIVGAFGLCVVVFALAIPHYFFDMTIMDADTGRPASEALIGWGAAILGGIFCFALAIGLLGFRKLR
jgi:hypothetical protein